MNEKIKAILAQKQSQEQPAAEQPLEEPVDSAFYQLYRGDSSESGFIEFRFRGGVQTAFSYNNLNWVNLDNASGMLDMDFMGFTVFIEGRGLKKVFDYIKMRKISWLSEADTELQDHAEFELFIKDIKVGPPDGFGEEEQPPTEAVE